jgi:hypothetical protein
MEGCAVLNQTVASSLPLGDASHVVPLFSRESSSPLEQGRSE